MYESNQTGIPSSLIISSRSKKIFGAESSMTNICGPHHLCVKHPSAMQFELTGNTLKSTSTVINRVGYGTDVTIEVEDLSKSYSISLPISGNQHLEGLHPTVSSNLSQGVIISPSQKENLHIDGDCIKHLVRISRTKMEQSLSSLLHNLVDEPLVFDHIIDAENGATADWWRTIKHIDSELRNPNQILYNNTSFVLNIEQALINGLLLSQKHNYTEELNRILNNSIPEYLKRAEMFISQNLQKDITINDIESAACISRNILYVNFKKHFGMPPTAYLKRLRLERAREDILQNRASSNITRIAYDWGFNHLGRFSQDYKNQFAETPSETRKRIDRN